MWFRSLFAGRKGSSARRRPDRQRPVSRRLSVEALEDRAVPASLTIGDATIIEDNIGVQYAEVSVSLDAASRKTVTVNYRTADGTALAGSDYQAFSGKLTFAGGETTKTIRVPVIGDRLAEPNETFSVHLSGAKGAKIADGTGVVAIVDDEPRLRIGDASVVEGNNGATLMTFTVSLSATYDEAVTVNYATADGTATNANNDYLAASGTLTFAPGETTKTITVEVVGDITGEQDETFYVNLIGASVNALLIDSQGLGYIVNDDVLDCGDYCNPDPQFA